MTVSVGLVGGSNIAEYSVAHIVWKQLLEQEKFDGEFSYYPAVSIENVISVLEKIRLGEILGVNVALPWKRAAADCCDIKSDSVRASGCANTIYGRRGKLIASNTDGRGFIRSITNRHLGNVLLFGAGGAGTVTAYELLIAGSKVVVIDVEKKAIDGLTAISRRWSNRANLEICNVDNISGRSFDLIVNATPLGRGVPNGVTDSVQENSRQQHSSPVPVELLKNMPKSCLCAEMNYYPEHTRFLSDAISVGLATVPGLSMLIHQAALSYTEYTGHELTQADLRQLEDSLTNNLYGNR